MSKKISELDSLASADDNTWIPVAKESTGEWDNYRINAGGFGSGGSVTVSSTSPTSPGEGDLWYDDVNTTLYVFVAGTTNAWIQTNGGGGGGDITVQDEGSSLATAATTLNFVGSGVVASGTGATKTITIAGGGSDLSANLGGKYVADWATSHGGVAVANGATMTITHNLGTDDIIVQAFVADDSGGTNAQNIKFSHWDGDVTYGHAVVDPATNSVVIQLANSGYIDITSAGGKDHESSFSGKFIKVVVLSAGAGGSSSSGTTSGWSSGWVDTDGTNSLANGATLTFTHDLGTTDVNFIVYVADDGQGTNAQDFQRGHATGTASAYGGSITNITPTTVTVQLASVGYLDMSTSGEVSTTNFATGTKHIKVIGTSTSGGSTGGSGGGSGGSWVSVTPADGSFITTDVTLNASEWTDMDVSSIVGTEDTLALTYWTQGTADNFRTVAIRRTGDNHAATGYGGTIATHSGAGATAAQISHGNGAYILAPITAGHFEVYSEFAGGNWTGAIVGYFKSGGTGGGTGGGTVVGAGDSQVLFNMGGQGHCQLIDDTVLSAHMVSGAYYHLKSWDVATGILRQNVVPQGYFPCHTPGNIAYSNGQRSYFFVDWENATNEAVTVFVTHESYVNTLIFDRTAKTFSEIALHGRCDAGHGFMGVDWYIWAKSKDKFLHNYAFADNTWNYTGHAHSLGNLSSPTGAMTYGVTQYTGTAKYGPQMRNLITSDATGSYYNKYGDAAPYRARYINGLGINHKTGRMYIQDLDTYDMHVLQITGTWGDEGPAGRWISQCLSGTRNTNGTVLQDAPVEYIKTVTLPAFGASIHTHIGMINFHGDDEHPAAYSAGNIYSDGARRNLSNTIIKWNPAWT